MCILDEIRLKVFTRLVCDLFHIKVAVLSFPKYFEDKILFFPSITTVNSYFFCILFWRLLEYYLCVCVRQLTKLLDRILSFLFFTTTLISKYKVVREMLSLVSERVSEISNIPLSRIVFIFSKLLCSRTGFIIEKPFSNTLRKLQNSQGLYGEINLIPIMYFIFVK